MKEESPVRLIDRQGKRPRLRQRSEPDLALWEGNRTRRDNVRRGAIVHDDRIGATIDLNVETSGPSRAGARQELRTGRRYPQAQRIRLENDAMKQLDVAQRLDLSPADCRGGLRHQLDRDREGQHRVAVDPMIVEIAVDGWIEDARDTGRLAWMPGSDAVD